jgi:hypothetical protein
MIMQKLDLVYGSDKWLETRLKYFCASEAPAMKNDSKFMSRNQLLAIKKGRILNPIGEFKKNIFNTGLKNEEEARKLHEVDRCEHLPPIVGLTIVDGLELLSSFDGFGDFGYIWEHKSWNEVLSENVRNAVLEPMYYWQLEHQMLTAGVDEVDFMVSDGTREKRISMIYKSVPKRRSDLIAGWKQFKVDLDQYKIVATTEAVVAKEQYTFPSIECRVEGSIVISNLGDYIPLIQRVADDQMRIVLETDQDFADKDAFNKQVKEGRASLKLKAGQIETVFESLAEFNGYVKQADSILQKLQSHGERQVKEAKEAKKLAVIDSAQSSILAHLTELSGTIDGVLIQNVAADWNSIIKGKRNFENIQSAVDSEIARLKIQSNEIAAAIRKNLDSLTEVDEKNKFLFSDHAELVLKDNEDLVNLIKMRVSEYEKSEEERFEKERQLFQEEAEAKALAKAESERERIRKKERQLLQAEAKARAAEESWAQALARAEAKANAQAEEEKAWAQAESEAEAKALAKEEAEAEEKAWAKAAAKADAEVEAKADAWDKAKAQALADEESKAKAWAKSWANEEAFAEIQAEAETLAEAEVEVESKALAKAWSWEEARSKAKAWSWAEAQAKAKVWANEEAWEEVWANEEPKSKAKAEEEAEEDAEAWADDYTWSWAKAKAKAKAWANEEAWAEDQAEAQAEAQADDKAWAETLAESEVEVKAKAEEWVQAEEDAEAQAEAKEEAEAWDKAWVKAWSWTKAKAKAKEEAKAWSNENEEAWSEAWAQVESNV